MPDTTQLNMAVTSNNPLAQMQQYLLQRAQSMPPSQELSAQRQSALQQYQNSLRQPPMGNYTGTEHALYNWIGNIGHASPAAAVNRGIAAGGDWVKANQEGLVRGDQLASKVGYDDAVGQDKENMALEKAMFGLSKGSLGKQPTPEQIRTVYTGAVNTAAQAAKDYSFKSAEERMAWIQKKAAEVVDTYIANYATQPLGPRGVTETPTDSSSPTTTPGIAEQQPTGEVPAVRNIPLIQAELSRQKPGTDAYFILQQELEREMRNAQGAQQPGTMPQAQGATPPVAMATPPMTMNPATQARPGQLPQGNQAAPINPPPRNIPNEKLQQTGNEKMGASYAKDYEDALTKARTAEQQLAAFNMLEKVQPNTNVFANASEQLAGIFSAFGQDPNAPIIQNAIKNRQSNLILDQLRNAALRDENGVQTRTDEIRIANEFPKTTDFRQAWNFGIKLGKERALRSQERLKLYDGVAEANNGVPVRARQVFDREFANDPLTQYYGGKLIFRSDYIRSFMALNPEASPLDAVDSWRAKEVAYQARGGRK